MKVWFKHPVSTIVGPISESEMVLRSSPPGYYQANIAMRSIFWPADSVTEHTDVGEGRIDSGDASYNIIWTSCHPSLQLETAGCSYDEQGVAHQRSTEMCQSVWLPPVAHTTNPWRMTEVYETGLLTRTLDPGTRHYYDRGPGSGTLANPVSNQNHKVLCRAIGQGITQARG